MKASGISLFCVNAHRADVLLVENFLHCKVQLDIWQVLRKIDTYYKNNASKVFFKTVTSCDQIGSFKIKVATDF